MLSLVSTHDLIRPQVCPIRTFQAPSLPSIHWFWAELAGIYIADLQSRALVHVIDLYFQMHICTYLLVQARIPVFGSLTALNPAFLGVGAGLCIAILWSALMENILMKRAKEEEMMLKHHFGRDWDVYANKHWRLIPFVY